MAIRAKMQVQSIARYANVVGAEVTLTAVYDAEIPEDIRFQTATPSGSLRMFVTNPHVVDQLTLGTFFYLTLEPSMAGEASDARESLRAPQ